ncbi:hypothetical protein ACHAXR_009110 [Thalassiosira sp. AJA248-18]
MAKHTMMTPKRPLLTTVAAVAALFLSPITIATDPANNKATATAGPHHQQCERLPSSLTYSQDSAPADVSAILRVVVEKINRDVTGVVDVEVAWSGAELHKRVGERIVRCTVTRLADYANNNKSQSIEVDEHGRSVVTQCFEVPFTILDVNECTVPRTNSMAHRCHPPSVCVNTLGSYECICPSESSDSVINNSPVNTPDFVALPNFWRQLSSESAASQWEVSLGSSSESSCPSSPSTHGCCDEDGHSKEGQYCRSSFRCPVDPCAAPKQKSATAAVAAACASNAICQRSASPLAHPNYACQCPPNLMGNGHPCSNNNNMKNRKMIAPKVKYDGVTPTEETRRALDAGLICGCVEPTVDACEGFPKCPGKHEMCTVKSDNTPHCTCQPGYTHDPDYGCVDESPPILTLRHPDDSSSFDPKTGIVHLSQGDKYEEYGVDVIDDNAEEYLRSLKITYSRPLPQGCLLEMGQFTVSYTVAMPWTTPEFVRSKRTVVIDNVNECMVTKSGTTATTTTTGGGVGAKYYCPELVAMCDVESGASCIDEIGTYTCQCPEGTEGDGFMPIPRLKSDGKGGFVGSMVPKGYLGGKGCRDISKPVVELLGPNPKRFRVARASGVHGVLRTDESDESIVRVEALIAEQRSAYESDIRSLIRSTSGAELCATSTKSNALPTDCVRAQDHTYKGIVDLTSRVSVGEPVPKDNASLQWKVAYNVVDDAGNEAETVWRDIIVEEVDINDFEQRANADALANRKDEVDRAVDDALTKERRKQQQSGSSNSREACPQCEPCICSNNGQTQQRGSGSGTISRSECNATCDAKIDAAVSSLSSVAGSSDASCTSSYLESDSSAASHEIIQEMLVFMEGLMGPSAMMLLLLGCTLATILYVLQRMFTALFFSTGPNVRTYYHTREDDEQERVMMQNVSYYRSPAPSARGSTRQSTPGSAASSAVSTPRPPPTASLSSQRR